MSNEATAEEAAPREPSSAPAPAPREARTDAASEPPSGPAPRALATQRARAHAPAHAGSDHGAPSAWSRLPDADELGAAARAAGRVAGRVATSVGHSMRDGAGVVARGMGAGIDRASHALAVPESAEVSALLGMTDLPALTGGDTLLELAGRLDREADLFRGLALRAVARAQWADRLAIGASVLAALGAAALAVVCALGALFGAGNAGARSGLALVAMLVLLLGAGAVLLATGLTRRAQRTLAREALSRADLAELRMQRVAVVLALRDEDHAAYQLALARLERDAAAPPR